MAEERLEFTTLHQMNDYVRERMDANSIANWEERAREMGENPRAAALFILHHLSQMNANIRLLDQALTNVVIRLQQIEGDLALREKDASDS
jgi:hypothetical protein